jgi:hypothetical protein
LPNRSDRFWPSAVWLVLNFKISPRISNIYPQLLLKHHTHTILVVVSTLGTISIFVNYFSFVPRANCEVASPSSLIWPSARFMQFRFMMHLSWGRSLYNLWLWD